MTMMTMILRYNYCILLLLVLIVKTAAADADADASTPPTFQKWELTAQQQNQNQKPHQQQQKQQIVDDELRQILSTTGLFAVELIPPADSSSVNNKAGEEEEENNDDDDNNTRRIALNGLCSCYDDLNNLLSNLDNQQQQSQSQHIHSMLLQDNKTHRTSIGTATIGTKIPLSLPNELLEKICTTKVVDAMEELRENINDVTKSVLQMLDRLFLLEENNNGRRNVVPLLRDSYNKQYYTFTDIVESSTNLEHFHVYHQQHEDQNNDQQHQQQQHQQNQEEEDQEEVTAATAAVWDWHTDAGLFLVFVPAWDCSNDINDSMEEEEENIDTAFWYQDNTTNGKAIQAKFKPNTAIVMMGQGAQDWLNLHNHNQPHQNNRNPLIRATVHSVRFPKHRNYHHGRAWYGTMQLVPENAVISNNGKQQTTLSQIKSNLLLNSNDDDDVMISLGCGSTSAATINEDGEEETSAEAVVLPTRRRRLQHQDPSGCNNVTNFFCWMQCLPIPNAKEMQGYVNEGYSLYCLDPAILASSGGKVSQAAEPCKNGWIHDPACEGMWQITVPNVVPAVTINATADPDDVEQPFCYGGTTMYMDGFYFIQGTTCVIYLFQSWVLNSNWKFVIAFFGTILGGILLEKIIQQRRRVMSSLSSSSNSSSRYSRLAASAIFYGIQLSLGYMLMLVIMIYSGILFIATILGLVSGHVMFNAKDAIWPLKDSSPDDEEDDDDEDNDEQQGGDDFADTTTNDGLEFEELHHGIDMEGGQRHAAAAAAAGISEQPIMKGGKPSCCSKMDIMDPTEELTTELSTTRTNNNTYGYGSRRSAADETGSSTTSGSNTTSSNKNGNTTTQKERTTINKNNNINHGVAEGATPCCQHAL